MVKSNRIKQKVQRLCSNPWVHLSEMADKVARLQCDRLRWLSLVTMENVWLWRDVRLLSDISKDDNCWQCVNEEIGIWFIWIKYLCYHCSNQILALNTLEYLVKYSCIGFQIWRYFPFLVIGIIRTISEVCIWELLKFKSLLSACPHR